jgi:hypothetical protein
MYFVEEKFNIFGTTRIEEYLTPSRKTAGINYFKMGSGIKGASLVLWHGKFEMRLGALAMIARTPPRGFFCFSRADRQYSATFVKSNGLASILRRLQLDLNGLQL